MSYFKCHLSTLSVDSYIIHMTRHSNDTFLGAVYLVRVHKLL